MNVATTRSQSKDLPPALGQSLLLQVRGLTKVFPGIVAVDNVVVAIGGGEIVALLGQNGAGKSKLIQVLSGVHPDGTYSGDVFIKRALLKPSTVDNPTAAGIVFLDQEM